MMSALCPHFCEKMCYYCIVAVLERGLLFSLPPKINCVMQHSAVGLGVG